MKGLRFVVSVGLCAACAPQRPAVEGPAPSTAQAEHLPSELPSARADSALPPPPALDVSQFSPDTAMLRGLTRDSTLDAAILEQLNEETPTATEPTSGSEAEVDLAEMFDINVARYADHTRVRFYLDFFQGRARERMAVWLTRLPYYEPIVRSAFQAQGLPSDLVYLGLIESGYSNTAVSRAKAVGMWQFMKGTGKLYGLTIDKWVDDRRDFLKATNAAARYLADLTKSFKGSAYLAAAAYNGGPGRVMRGLKRIGAAMGDADDEEDETDSVESTVDDRFFELSDTRYLRKQTKDYVPKLIAAAMIAKQPERYGFSPIPKVETYNVDSIPVTEATSLEVIARAGDTPMADLVFLNPQFIRGMTPPGRTVWVRLPLGKGVAATEALAAIPTAERVPAMTHLVGRKESLKSIAHRYGISEAQLIQFNPGLSAKTIRPGTTLRVPGTVRVRSLVVDDERDAVAKRARARIHKVTKGETLASIAEHFHTTPERLKALNGLKSSTVRLGQRLRVDAPVKAVAKSTPRTKAAPAARVAAKATTDAAHSRSVHVIRKGETLSGVARRYGVTVEALMSANGLRSPAVRAGTRLTIPS